jgi:hypothetical protein
MTFKYRIVGALLHIYPAAWRREYGAELADILVSRPFDLPTIADVVCNGLRQRVRAAEPSTLCGLAAMLVISTGLVVNIAAPDLAGRGLTALLQESSMTLPTVIATPLASDLFGLFVVGCGCWTHVRGAGALSESGKAGMKLCFIAGIPLMVAGALMLVGVLNVVVVSPGDTATTLLGRRFTYTYTNAQHHALSPLAVMAAPLFKLPVSWIWGWVGGQLGRRLVRAHIFA